MVWPSDQPRVTPRRQIQATGFEEISQVAVRSELNDDKQGSALCAATKEIDDVAMSSDDFHHFHFLHQIGQLTIRGVTWRTPYELIDK